MPHKYTVKQKQFIQDNYRGISTSELTTRFNIVFSLELRESQIRAFKKNRKLSSGVDSKFRKGNTPYNKGKKGVGGWSATRFEKGHTPYNYKPIGSERVNCDGYVDIKVADPKKWKGKHIVLWEQHNGPVPKGHAVIFGDKNNRNFDIDNLILVSKRQLAILNSNRMIKEDVELTRLGVVMASIKLKVGERIK